LSLAGHTAEIVSVCFSNSGDLVATGSFDHDSRLWDVRTGQCVHVLSGHRGEVSSTVFNYSGTVWLPAGGAEPPWDVRCWGSAKPIKLPRHTVGVCLCWLPLHGLGEVTSNLPLLMHAAQNHSLGLLCHQLCDST
jgi:WD40 repeat protein